MPRLVSRLEVAKRFDATTGINSADGNAVERIMKSTDGRGVDTAIEAVGIQQTLQLCEKRVAPGGSLANIGVHGRRVDAHLKSPCGTGILRPSRGWSTRSARPMPFKILRSHKIYPKHLITRRFKLDRIHDAHETFAHAASTRALKVII